MSTPEPLVSIIIPTRNRPDSIEAAVRSVLDQHYQNVEVVVVDDGSEPAYAPAANDRRIRVLRLEKPVGVAAARNRGMDFARGELLGLLDDDDWYHPDKIARQAAFLLEHPEIDLVFSRMAIIDDKGNTTYHLPRGHVHTAEINFAAFNVIHTNSSLFRRSMLDRVRFDERLTKYTDMQFYLAATAHAKVAYLEGVAGVWCRQFRPDQITRRGTERNLANFRLVCRIFEDQILPSRELRRRYYGRLLVSSVRALKPVKAIKCACLISGLRLKWLLKL